jgi:hypothetical protein
VFLVFKFGGCLDLCTLRFLISLYCISCYIGDNVSFKFRGVDKHSIFFFLFYLLFCWFLFAYICFCLYINFFIAMLLIRHNLHHNCDLYVIDVVNLFQHYILLEIPDFDSCVRLKRLHLFN